MSTPALPTLTESEYHEIEQFCTNADPMYQKKGAALSRIPYADYKRFLNMRVITIERAHNHDKFEIPKCDVAAPGKNAEEWRNWLIKNRTNVAAFAQPTTATAPNIDPSDDDVLFLAAINGDDVVAPPSIQTSPEADKAKRLLVKAAFKVRFRDNADTLVQSFVASRAAYQILEADCAISEAFQVKQIDDAHFFVSDMLKARPPRPTQKEVEQSHDNYLSDEEDGSEGSL